MYSTNENLMRIMFLKDYFVNIVEKLCKANKFHLFNTMESKRRTRHLD